MFGLPTWAWKTIGYAVIALTILGVGLRIASVWDQHTIATLKANNVAAAAQAHATTVAQKQITVVDAKAETTAQATIKAQAVVVHKRIASHVASTPITTVGCVTWGMLRVHDAAVTGDSPDSLEPPAGQPDNACSTISPSDFMAVIADNYDAARANAEQLNSLEADLNARGQATVNIGDYLTPTVSPPAATVTASPAGA